MIHWFYPILKCLLSVSCLFSFGQTTYQMYEGEPKGLEKTATIQFNGCFLLMVDDKKICSRGVKLGEFLPGKYQFQVHLTSFGPKNIEIDLKAGDHLQVKGLRRTENVEVLDANAVRNWVSGHLKLIKLDFPPKVKNRKQLCWCTQVLDAVVESLPKKYYLVARDREAGTRHRIKTSQIVWPDGEWAGFKSIKPGQPVSLTYTSCNKKIADVVLLKK